MTELAAAGGIAQETRVLVVLDDELLAEVVRLTLNHGVYVTRTVKNAVDATAAVAEWRPKLAISAYHRPSDLWRVAETVRALCPDYDLFLRQHDGGVIETVLYALPSRGAGQGQRNRA